MNHSIWSALQNQTMVSMQQRQPPLNAEQNVKDEMQQFQNFLAQNMNTNQEQLRQVASQLNISQEYIDKSVRERQNQNILTSLNPHFRTGDRPFPQALPMPPICLLQPSADGTLRPIPINGQSVISQVNAVPPPPPQPKKQVTQAPQPTYVANPPPVKIPRLSEVEKKIKPLLDANQGVASADNVSQILKLMGSEKTQNGRQIYLEAMLNTSKNNILKKFVELKSVDLLKKWLEDAKEKDKAEVMENVMKVIMKLPLTVEVLTSSGIGKLVAQLKKDTSLNEDVKKMTGELMAHLKQLAQTSSQSILNLPSVPKTKKQPPTPQENTDKTSKVVKEKEPQTGGIFSVLTAIPKKTGASSTSKSAKEPKDGRRAVQSIELDPSATTRSNLAKTNVNAKYSSKPLSADEIQKNKKKDQQRPMSTQQNLVSPSNKRKAESAPSTGQSDVKRARIDIATCTTVAPTSAKDKKKVRFPDSEEHMVKIRYIPNREELMEMMQEEQQANKDNSMDWSASSPPQQRHAQQAGSPNSPSPQSERALEKMMFLQRREEKKRKLQAMQATTEYKLIPLVGIEVPVPKRTEEFIKQKDYVSTHAMVVYRSTEQIPETPSSPVRDQPPNMISTTDTSNDFLSQLLGTINTALHNPQPSPQQVYNPAPTFAPPTVAYSAPNQQSQFVPTTPFVPPPTGHAFGAAMNQPPSQVYRPPHAYQQQPPQQQPPPPPQQQFMPPTSISQMYGMPIPTLGGPTPPATNGFGAIRPGDPNFGPNPNQRDYQRDNRPNFRSDERNMDLSGAGSMKPSGRIAAKSIRCRFYETEIGCRNGKNCQFWHKGDPIPQGGIVEYDPEIAKMIRSNNPPATNKNDRGGERDSRHKKDDHYRR